MLGNLVAYSVQVAVLVVVGGLAAAVLHLKQPRVMLAYWQALLAACLLLPLFQPWQQEGLAPAQGSATILGTAASAIDSRLDLFPLHACVLLVLVAGLGVGLLRLVLGLRRLDHYRRAAVRVDPLPGTLSEAQALVSVAATFYISDRIESPVTFGWLRPAVIFPRRFERMDESQQRAIACHELLHVARRDWPVNFLEEVILVFFWFHPAIRWAIRNIRLAREQVVDGEVVALAGARKSYLHALLEIAAAPRAITLPAPLLLVESQLTRRVASMVKEVRMSKPRLIASLAIAFAVLVGAGSWAVKTFWLRAPLGSPTHMIGYIYSSGGPGGGFPSTFMYYMAEGDGRAGFSLRDFGRAQIKGPVPISMPGPPYTSQAKKDKVEGAVFALVDVDADGNVAAVRLTAVSLSRNLTDGLDQSVIDTVRTWKFRPATKKGKPLPVTVHVRVNFSLS
jgi:TonB family protein